MNEEQQLESNTENIDDNRNKESVKEGSSKEERKRKRKLYVKRFFKGVGILILVLIAVKILQFGIAHHNKSKYRDREYVQQDMLNYLEERYGEEFVMESYTGMGYAYQNYDEMFAYPKGKDKEKYKFQVQGYYNKWGNMNYYDTYVYQKLKDEYEKRLDPYIAEYFDEYKFYLGYFVEWVTSNLPADITLDEMLEGGGYYRPRLYIYIKPGTPMSRSKVKEICERLQSDQMRMDVTFWFVEDEDMYKKMNRDDIKEFWDYKYFHEMIDAQIYIDIIKYWDEEGEF